LYDVPSQIYGDDTDYHTVCDGYSGANDKMGGKETYSFKPYIHTMENMEVEPSWCKLQQLCHQPMMTKKGVPGNLEIKST
jgi:hypothetical protein